MDKLEQENIDELIKRQTGDSVGKLKVEIEDNDTTMESLQVSTIYCNAARYSLV